MKDIEKIYQECLQDIQRIGIHPGNIKEVKINRRFRKSFGLCRRIREPWKGVWYRLEFNPEILKDEVPDAITKSTVIHEILHSCYGCMKHTGRWKAYAEKVNQAYPEYQINRLVTAEEMQAVQPIQSKPKYHYYVICDKCKKLIGYQKRGNVWKYPERYRCKCGGKLQRAIAGSNGGKE